MLDLTNQELPIRQQMWPINTNLTHRTSMIQLLWILLSSTAQSTLKISLRESLQSTNTNFTTPTSSLDMATKKLNANKKYIRLRKIKKFRTVSYITKTRTRRQSINWHRWLKVLSRQRKQQLQLKLNLQVKLPHSLLRSTHIIKLRLTTTTSPTNPSKTPLSVFSKISSPLTSLESSWRARLILLAKWADSVT